MLWDNPFHQDPPKYVMVEGDCAFCDEPVQAYRKAGCEKHFCSSWCACRDKMADKAVRKLEVGWQLRYLPQCQWCGNHFDHKSRYSKARLNGLASSATGLPLKEKAYCSPRCSLASNKQRQGETRAKWKAENEIERECVRCGERFFTTRNGTNPRKYCTKACNRALLQHKKKIKITTQELHTRDGGRCWLCDYTVSQDKAVPHPLAAVRDHVVPRSMGGSGEPENIRLAHFLCNSVRGDREPLLKSSARQHILPYIQPGLAISSVLLAVKHAGSGYTIPSLRRNATASLAKWAAAQRQVKVRSNTE